MYGKRLRGLALLTVALLTLTLVAVFFWAPNDATTASCRRSSTSTCRWRSSRCAASSPAA